MYSLSYKIWYNAVFEQQFCEIFKGTYFVEHLRMAASECKEIISEKYLRLSHFLSNVVCLGFL